MNGGCWTSVDEPDAVGRRVRRGQVADRLAQLAGSQLRAVQVRVLLGPDAPQWLADRLTGDDPDTENGGPPGIENGGPPGIDPDDPLAADVVLAGMDGADRTALRRRAAEAAYEAGLPAVPVGRLLCETEPGWPDWALEALLAAAAAARAERCWEAAARLYDRALREPMDEPLRLATGLALGEVQLSCRPEAAGRTFCTVLRTAPAALPSPVRIAAADRLLVRGDDEAARRELAATHDRTAAAARDAPRTARPVLAAERAAIAAMYWLASDRVGAAPELVLDRVPAPTGAGEDPAGRGVLAWREALAGEDLELTRRHALAALDPPAGAVVPPGVQVAAARALILTEHFDTAERRLTELIDAHRGAGGYAAVPLTVRAELWLRTGRLEEAERDLYDLRRCLPEQSWHASTLPRLRALQVLQLLATDRPAQAAAVLRADLPPGSERGPAWTELLYARAVAEAGAGRLDTAVRLLRECGRRCLAAGHRNPALLPWRSQAALWEYARGEAAGATALLEAERLAAGRWGAGGTVALTALRAALLHDEAATRADRAVVALWAAMRGSWSVEALLTLEATAAARTASSAADAAVRAATRIGPGNPWRARAAAVASGFVADPTGEPPARRAPGPPSPATPAGSARGGAPDPGPAEPLNGGQSGGTPANGGTPPNGGTAPNGGTPPNGGPRPGRPVPGGAPVGGPLPGRYSHAGGDARCLSAAQLRVAELAAGGLPNAAIAQILAVTKRTVELHLSNAYRRLGITSRAELSDVLNGSAGEHSSMC